MKNSPVCSPKAAVAWTGGKDCALAFYEARQMGYAVTRLVTFVPDQAEFLAHPVGFMKIQAEAMNLPHQTIIIHEPFRDGYEQTIRSLKKQHGIEVLVTGDIAEVDGHPNWIRECSQGSGVEVVTPLWGRGRDELMSRLIEQKFQVIFSCVKKPWFTDDWLERELNTESLQQLRVIRAETGLDLCGENGEYHTLVLDGPIFNKSIQMDSCEKRGNGSLRHLQIQSARLIERSAVV